MTLYYAHAAPRLLRPASISVRTQDGALCVGSALTLTALAQQIESRFVGTWISPAGNDIARYHIDLTAPGHAP